MAASGRVLAVSTVASVSIVTSSKPLRSRCVRNCFSTPSGVWLVTILHSSLALARSGIIALTLTAESAGHATNCQPGLEQQPFDRRQSRHTGQKAGQACLRKLTLVIPRHGCHELAVLGCGEDDVVVEALELHPLVGTLDRRQGPGEAPGRGGVGARPS